MPAGNLEKGMACYVVQSASAALVEHIEAILSCLASWWRWDGGRKFRLKLHEPQFHFAKGTNTSTITYLISKLRVHVRCARPTKNANSSPI